MAKSGKSQIGASSIANTPMKKAGGMRTQKAVGVKVKGDKPMGSKGRKG